MALRKPKDGNLSLLIQAIASAFHRDANGVPRIQPISFRAKGISSATLHLWVHNGVENVTPRKMKILADAYGLDFATTMAFIFGPPSRMEGDELLAYLRRLPPPRPRPISGGSHAGAALPVAERAAIVDEVLGDPLPVAKCPPSRDIMSTWAHRIACWWGCTLGWGPMGLTDWAGA